MAEATKIEPFIEGSLFYLRPVEEEDYVEHYLQWINDQDVTRFLSRGTNPTSKADIIEAFHNLRKSQTDIEFTIVLKSNDAPIGLTGLHEINSIYRSGEFRILIGDKNQWGKGIGSQILQLITAYGFETHNLNRVSLGVNAANVGAAKSYEKAGFKTEGLLRQAIYRNGKYYDVSLMSLLKDEYLKALKAWPCKKMIIQRFQNSD